MTVLETLGISVCLCRSGGWVGGGCQCVSEGEEAVAGVSLWRVQ